MTEMILTSGNRFGNDSVMELKTYAETNEGTGKRGCPVLARVAIDAGCSPETLYMISAGHKRPSGTLSSSIIKATGGAVTGPDLRPDIFGEIPKTSKRAAA
jgi:hypothetical protein